MYKNNAINIFFVFVSEKHGRPYQTKRSSVPSEAERHGVTK